ncbi:hypothetical protein G7Y31_05020 [Corynebacterium lizhenjunii]|uniref:Uncharacterized protein n=1 Tax=Corynebacterium lizhenjunii TaxID=2709394 RepID=A0A7T0PAM9_9CORY|nr:hypothetical protein [Corynebacterium lizhenjunii]QPK80053.1 hypothetical protein G7Y31_05020 [Corynebacterium lizhenjunii]
MPSPQDLATVPEEDIDLVRAAQANAGGFVQERFRGRVEVLPDYWGVESVREFFPDSEALIIAENSAAPLLRAASLSVAQRVPMVIFDSSVREEIFRLVKKLGVRHVLLVGQVPVTASTGTVEVVRDPGTTSAMGVMTAFQFDSKVVGSPEQIAQAVAQLDPGAHTELKAAWEPLARREHLEAQPLPAQPRRDGQMAPVVVATAATSPAAVANARAFGAEVRIMPTANPQESKAAYAMVAGLDNGPLVALGEDFGDPHLLSDRIGQGWRE